MFTTTTELDSAIARPSVTAPSRLRAQPCERDRAGERADRDLKRDREKDPARLATQRAEVELDADLEQK